MWVQILVAWLLFVPPVYLIIEHWHMGLLAAWLWGVVYVTVLGAVFWFRFRTGYWKTVRMIHRA
jgi:MATE family multidrug resistance protein